MQIAKRKYVVKQTETNQNLTKSGKSKNSVKFAEKSWVQYLLR